ncbi:MAG: hypothetical protein DSN99_08825 [Archaeoglobi archaeon]|jgi:hypothetical protein|nr:hypothetical protein [Archaeoglobus sp.]TDA25179.1 MAG: hypothetical protein DSN99_08825 [Archaeoglobi archaeon]
MRESVEKELEVLKKMVSAWRKFYEETPYPGCERDFSFEIEEYLLPYLRRLYECGYINDSQINDFLSFCYEQIEELCRNIGKKLEV